MTRGKTVALITRHCQDGSLKKLVVYELVQNRRTEDSHTYKSSVVYDGLRYTCICSRTFRNMRSSFDLITSISKCQRRVADYQGKETYDKMLYRTNCKF